MLARVKELLRKKRYRVALGDDEAVAAERGHLPEAGNLLFRDHGDRECQ